MGQGNRNTEWDLINRIQKLTGKAGGDLIRGIGDDCAVVRRNGGQAWLLTTDTLLESIHFDLHWHPPRLLGRKSASVNISDVAAMGGAPCYAMLSLGLPAPYEPAWLDDFLDGFVGVLKEHGVQLIGGDTVRSQQGVAISVTLVGEAAEADILYRSGARPGNLVWISGGLGGAAAGLALCRQGMREQPDQPAGFDALINAHLDPTPQTDLAMVLAASGQITAMMDLSDGLATDLAHLCTASNAAAEIAAEAIPMASGLLAAADQLNMSALEWALRGGEDYQLLFTTDARESEAPALQQLIRDKLGREIFCLGRIVVGHGVILSQGTTRKQIAYQGHDHFG